ncbi:ferredoxin [Dactylosporangium sp. CA-139066]|uniref:ferredoxin n=1 Tax=Dactylosporangium sp. CA-139066 TaxID=3239930 RepID=UPI003D91BC62
MVTPRISADTGVCVSSGMCAMMVPEVFDQREEDGRVVVRREQPPPELADRVHDAVHSCPSGALRLDED